MLEIIQLCKRLFPIIVWAILLAQSPAIAGISTRQIEAGKDELTCMRGTAESHLRLEFCVKCPDKYNETDVELCIPAAFTTIDGGVDGLALVDGKKVGGALNPHLTGSAVFIDGDYQIVPTSTVTPQLITSMQKKGASLFQQFQLIKDGVRQSFNKDKKTFRRRALVVFSDGARGVVQSREAITMNQFAAELKQIGIRNALYTPIADGDGGWRREAGKPVSIGIQKPGRPIESNWVIWRKSHP